MPRPKNQTARRAQLVNAAAETVLEHGSAAAKLRDVAERAGLTPASVLYYYPDIQDLLAAVFEHASAVYCQRRAEQIAEAAGSVQQLRACIRSGLPRDDDTENTTRLLFELLPVALRNQATTELQRAFVAQQTALYQRVLEAGEQAEEFRLTAAAPVLARSFVALEDGYALDTLVGAATPDDIEEWLLLHARTVTRAEI